MFLVGMFFSIAIIWSSYSWIAMWVGVELNMIMFLSLIFMSKEFKKLNLEGAVKYFLVQVIGSMMLIFSFFFMFKGLNFMWGIMLASLGLKLGMAPLHFWFPEVVLMYSWDINFYLFTVQKLGPMIMMYYCFIMSLNNIYLLLILCSSMVGALGGFMQMDFRKIMAYSSISHMGWMMIGLLYYFKIWSLYFFIYLLLNYTLCYLFKKYNINNFNTVMSNFSLSFNLKYMFLMLFFSLGGMPPFLGFYSKWMVIEGAMMMNMGSLMIIMILMVLLTLYYYLRMVWGGMLMSSPLNLMLMKVKENYFLIMLNLTNVLALIFVIFFF
uniref:NADH dehydrogenase subunit 2 n=1 Tax=Lophogaster typicus TaxID=419538 RepID=UPI002176EF5D|nr:NADH dehydrogenase subunit 2 [Lophogaster typicus]UUL70705.1 NADH dehydrogenase subunit 2 [Lophogaster typicus]